MFHPRAGVYASQPAGYEAFLPAPLPPDPPVLVDLEMLDLLSRANCALGRLDGVTDALPNADLFASMYVRKEAVLSNQIDGVHASLTDVLEFEASEADDAPPKDVDEVVNYLTAMAWGLSRAEKMPVSLRLVLEVHARMFARARGSDRLPGEFRKTQTWIGPPHCTVHDALFVPPPPAEMLDALGGLEAFLNGPAPVPVLIKAGLAHAQFENIHPFLEGNGRAGRLLVTFLLAEQKILKRPLLYLSGYFKEHRPEYHDRLQRVRDSGDWEGWLKFFLRGVHDVAEEATATARKIVELYQEHRAIVQQAIPRSALRALKLFDTLQYRPMVTVKAAAERVHLTFANANRLVTDLLALGLLAETTGHRRNRMFSYASYLELFR